MEGKTESAAYDTYACFCDERTGNKTSEISTLETSISTLSSTILQKTAQQEKLDADIKDLAQELADHQAALKRAREIRTKEKEVYTEAHNDAVAAVSALTRAITSINNGRPTFAQLKAIRTDLHKYLVIADMTGFKAKHTKVMTALISDEPWTQPTNQYDFHSDDILTTLGELKTTFEGQRDDLFNDETAANNAFVIAEGLKEGQITSTNTTLQRKKTKVAGVRTTISTSQGDMDTKNDLLHDNQAYLKDLTDQCEDRAAQWDQRSKMRTDELAAISKAKTILGTTVRAKAASSGMGGRNITGALVEEESAPQTQPAVFVQITQKPKVPLSDKNKAVLNLLKKEKSPKLKLFAMKLASTLAADPFAKVKTLIQDLIERLLAESADEATKKGWCDSETEIAQNQMNYRHDDIDTLTAQIQTDEARKEKLEEEKSTLTEELLTLRSGLTNATTQRGIDKTNNENTINDAKDGNVALNQAIVILQEFYNTAAKATWAFVQTKASPVDADIAAQGASAGFDGAYQGNQARATGIIGVLEVIKGDFDRSITKTTDMEAQQNRDYVKFSIETKASISAKDTALDNTNNDLVITTADLQAALNDLRDNRDLVDTAVQRLEALKAACIDTGMTYAERVAAREGEITALKKALCTLDEEDLEYTTDCQGVVWQFLQKN